MCILHKVETSDSLPRLSIMYNVTERQIKLLNNLPNDMIHHKDKLNIPMTEKFKYAPKKKKTEEEALNEEKARRDWAVSMMNQYISEVHRRPGADFNAEARYYCEANNFEYRKAKEAFDEDKAFEDEQKQVIKKKGYTKLHQD